MSFRIDRARGPLRALFCAVVLATGAVCARAAATDAPPSVAVAYAHDTGWVANAGSEPAVVASFVVSVDGAPWMRLAFTTVDLAAGAELRIVSALDGAEQTLNARTAREWSATSAYFNGDTLLVEVLAEPGAAASRVVLREATAGLDPVPVASLSQCGAGDDRVLSYDRRVARFLPAGCTAWLVDDCAHCLLSAGHCIAVAMVVEFDVPPSSSLGTIVHPPPSDQYPVDPFSVRYEDQGAGADWAYFGCFRNATTGLSPFEKQQHAFVLAAPVAVDDAATIRVTGYGADTTPPEANSVQQTDAGPWLGAQADVLSYQADTQGGNSGSPIAWDEGGVALGIHTHPGCDTSTGSGNRGTSIAHAALQAALANPGGVCGAPCGPSVVAYCAGKTNSLGCTPRITSSGVPSASGGAGSFAIGAEDVLTHKAGILVYGASAAAVPFDGGMWCVGAPVVRLPPQLSSGAADADDCSGTYGYDFGARIASGADPSLVAGARVYAQWWMRDPASAQGTIALTNGLAVVVGP